MNRTGLLIALAVAAVVGVIFGLRPDLDLKLAGPILRPGTRGILALLRSALSAGT